MPPAFPSAHSSAAADQHRRSRPKDPQQSALAYIPVVKKRQPGTSFNGACDWNRNRLRQSRIERIFAATPMAPISKVVSVDPSAPERDQVLRSGSPISTLGQHPAARDHQFPYGIKPRTGIFRGLRAARGCAYPCDSSDNVRRALDDLPRPPEKRCEGIGVDDGFAVVGGTLTGTFAEILRAPCRLDHAVGFWQIDG